MTADNNEKAHLRKRRSKAYVMALFSAFFICTLFMSGCAENAETTVTEVTGETEESTEAPLTPSGLTASQLSDYGVNELGSVPIMMYHRVIEEFDSDTQYTGGNADEYGLARTSESLIRDLENYYEWGYRCIRLSDFIDGEVDVELGCSPIILTFDDGSDQITLEGFDEEGNPIFSEYCAISVLESFKKEHPDFNLTATFFLYGNLFHYDEETNCALLKWLVNNGYDVGNHTRDHFELTDLTEEEIEEEVGYMYALFESVIPGQYVNITALPDGVPEDVTSDAKYDKIFSGTYGNCQYTTKAVLLGSCTYSPSCFSDEMNINAIQRIRAYDNDGTDYDIEMNFDLLSYGVRYISDGDKDTIVYPASCGNDTGNTYGKNVIEY